MMSRNRPTIHDKTIIFSDGGTISGHLFQYILFSKTNQKESGVINMKGYATESGYMGFVEGTYMLFACEDDYREYMEEDLL